MKIKIILISFFLVLFLGVIGTVAVIGLAIVAPFDPGQQVFPIQNWAEHRYLTLMSSPEGQAQFGLQMFERRIRDLELLLGTPGEGDAVKNVSVEITHVLELFKSISPKHEADFRVIFLRDLDALLALLERMDKGVGMQTELIQGFAQQVAELRLNVENETVPLRALLFNGVIKEIPGSLEKNDSSTILVLAEMESQIIPFPPGSAGAKHLFYPLDGEHSELTCLSCHRDGIYSGTPGLCTDCHMEAKPKNHFAGQCVLCHTTAGWMPSTFNHQRPIAADCQSCHLSEVPVNHYQGQCSACHSTAAWLPATFDHQTAGAALCQNCHSGNAPPNHYSGQCSACHATTAWLPATFDHQAAGAVDCISCHTTVKPVNHYSGQCSACHSTTTWRPAGFNHQVAGASDCQTCHSNARPANHYSGQCSDCHSTTAWTPASFNHTFPTNHGGADGVCAKCHLSGNSSWTCFTCHNEFEMTKKHNEEGIADYVARCMECHADGDKHD